MGKIEKLIDQIQIAAKNMSNHPEVSQFALGRAMQIAYDIKDEIEDETKDETSEKPLGTCTETHCITKPTVSFKQYCEEAAKDNYKPRNLFGDRMNSLKEEVEKRWAHPNTRKFVLTLLYNKGIHSIGNYMAYFDNPDNSFFSSVFTGLTDDDKLKLRGLYLTTQEENGVLASEVFKTYIGSLRAANVLTRSLNICSKSQLFHYIYHNPDKFVTSEIRGITEATMQLVYNKVLADPDFQHEYGGVNDGDTE